MSNQFYYTKRGNISDTLTKCSISNEACSTVAIKRTIGVRTFSDIMAVVSYNQAFVII